MEIEKRNLEGGCVVVVNSKLDTFVITSITNDEEVIKTKVKEMATEKFLTNAAKACVGHPEMLLMAALCTEDLVKEYLDTIKISVFSA